MFGSCYHFALAKLLAWHLVMSVGIRYASGKAAVWRDALVIADTGGKEITQWQTINREITNNNIDEKKSFIFTTGMSFSKAEPMKELHSKRRRRRAVTSVATTSSRQQTITAPTSTQTSVTTTKTTATTTTTTTTTDSTTHGVATSHSKITSTKSSAPTSIIDTTTIENVTPTASAASAASSTTTPTTTTTATATTTTQRCKQDRVYQSIFGKYGVIVFAVTLGVACLVLWALIMVLVLPRLRRRNHNRKYSFRGEHNNPTPMPLKANDDVITSSSQAHTNTLGENSVVNNESETAVENGSNTATTGDSRKQANVTTFLLRQTSLRLEEDKRKAEAVANSREQETAFTSGGRELPDYQSAGDPASQSMPPSNSPITATYVDYMKNGDVDV